MVYLSGSIGNRRLEEFAESRRGSKHFTNSASRTISRSTRRFGCQFSCGFLLTRHMQVLASMSLYFAVAAAIWRHEVQRKNARRMLSSAFLAINSSVSPCRATVALISSFWNSANHFAHFHASKEDQHGVPPYTCVLPRGNCPPSGRPRVPPAFVSCSTVPWRASTGVSYFFFGGFGFTSRAPICRCRRRPHLIFLLRRFVEEFNEGDFLQKKVQRAIIVGFFNDQYFVGRTVELRIIDYKPMRGVRMAGGDEQASKRVLL